MDTDYVVYRVKAHSPAAKAIRAYQEEVKAFHQRAEDFAKEIGAGEAMVGKPSFDGIQILGFIDPPEIKGVQWKTREVQKADGGVMEVFLPKRRTKAGKALAQKIFMTKGPSVCELSVKLIGIGSTFHGNHMSSMGFQIMGGATWIISRPSDEIKIMKGLVQKKLSVYLKLKELDDAKAT